MTAIKIRDQDHYDSLQEVPLMEAPTYGAPQQAAINSVFDGHVQDLFGKIKALRNTLDEIEQLILSGAAKAKAALQGQVDLCVQINDEINHMNKVIADLKGQATTAAGNT